ncbi:Uncharacterised protein [Cedecea lapagei]|uniref:Transposase n=1 Tax=Cedecea lapagei TaxID=158823 RepID=A0A447V4A7_9ENTR|nr:Uncharacterised protein [Cedecea lapagei]
MCKARFTEHQIITILKSVEAGQPLNFCQRRFIDNIP